MKKEYAFDEKDYLVEIDSDKQEDTHKTQEANN